MVECPDGRTCARCGERAIAPCPLCGAWLCPKCFVYTGPDIVCSDCLDRLRDAGLDDADET